MDWSLTLWTVFVFLRLSLRFVSNVGLRRFSELTSAQGMTLLICKLFLNANEYMCSSLKSVKIATSAVGVRRRTRLISYPDFPRPSERETSLFLMETCIQW